MYVVWSNYGFSKYGKRCDKRRFICEKNNLSEKGIVTTDTVVEIISDDKHFTEPSETVETNNSVDLINVDIQT